MKSTFLSKTCRRRARGISFPGPSGTRFLLIVSCLLLFLSLDARGEPLVAHAHQLEKAGDQEGAARLLSAWLAGNPGASGSASVFEEYLRVEQDLPALLDESGRFLQSGRGVPGAGVQFEKIARLYDMSGRIEAARDAYLAAHAEGGSNADLVSAFFLSLEMNDTDSMTASLEGLAGKGQSEELLLRALLEIRAGDPSARATLIGLADQTGNTDVALKALWMLYERARSGGDAAGQAAARAKLGNRFAAAPEAALAAGPFSAGGAGHGPTVVRLPAPGPFDAGPTAPSGASTPPAVPALPKADSASSKADSASPKADSAQGASAQTAPASVESSSATPPAPRSSPLVSVQAGSFLVEENANDLMAELTRRGFAPVLVHELAQGKDRYRVLAGSGLEPEAAAGVMKKLSDAGLRGFLVQDK